MINNSKCSLCPRSCEIDRSRANGACGVGDKIKVNRVMRHMWEEPCISGESGSGAIFFSGCPLKCVFCQNMSVSHEARGTEMSVCSLADEMLRLQDEGVHNINLVSPTQFSDKIRASLDLIRHKLKIPVVYNTGGYEKASEIEKLRGYVDIFLTDIKYFSSEISEKYSRARDYFDFALPAFKKMLELQGECILDENGIMKSGVILRHLVLPTCRADSMKILEEVAENCDVSKFKLSLMSQYTPDFCDEGYKELKRKITTFEYQSVLDLAISLGYDGYMQNPLSASKKYTPDFK